MSLLMGYLCGATELRILRRDAKRRIEWAARPFIDNEQTKARICRAANELRLSVTLIRDGWYEDIGPYQYADIYNASLELADRRAAEFERIASEEERNRLRIFVYTNEAPIPKITPAEIELAKAIAGLRRAG